ncbi:MAG: hypothetical protein CMJ19_19880 [Phycisphaeraceae bacterium]|nr:hypothetical protein [Phycisphaeraceae bacterium]
MYGQATFTRTNRLLECGGFFEPLTVFVGFDTAHGDQALLVMFLALKVNAEFGPWILQEARTMSLVDAGMAWLVVWPCVTPSPFRIGIGDHDGHSDCLINHTVVDDRDRFIDLAAQDWLPFLFGKRVLGI